ncbi:MAG TPA: hypothetical protein VFV52_13595 [Bacilli bacterium]|nr:hypothetical protein [Bacilli bacterium]
MDNAQLDAILESVLPRYDMRVHGIAPLDAHTCLVDSDRGVKRLRIDTEARNVSKRHELWEHLAKNGFRRVPRHIRTLHGDPWVEVNDTHYTMADEWEGRVPQMSAVDMRLAGRNLARLHRAAKGLTLSDDLALPMRHGTWLNRFSKAGEELALRQAQWEGMRDHNPLQQTFLQHYDWIAEQINGAVNGLVEGQYEQAARQAQEERAFAVGDYRLSDLRIDPAGRVATLYVDDAVADIPLYDAAKFAHGLLERGENELATMFLDAYAEEAGLHQGDVMILEAYFNFPHAAYRHLTQYIRLKKGADTFAKRLEQAVATAQERKPILYGADSIRWT